MGETPVLYVITKLELGGAQKQLLSLISRLDTQAFAPFLFTGFDGPLLADALLLPTLRITRSRFLTRPVNPLKDIIAFWQIFLCIRRNKIQIVHTHSSKAGILGRFAAYLAGVPCIVHTVHGWSFHDFQPFHLRLGYIWLERLAARMSGCLITVSAFDKAKGIAKKIGRAHQYALVHYGLEERLCTTEGRSVREEFEIGDDEIVVGMIACFKPQKAPQDFIELASLIAPKAENVKFLLAGDGILRPRILECIRRHTLEKRVILTGWRRDIPKIITAMDIMVLTSLWEGMPIAVLEAMALSRPVIATHTGGVAEVIHEGETGYLVKPHDVKALAAKVRFLLENSAMRNTIGENAKRSLGRDFSTPEMVFATEGLYRALLSNRRGLRKEHAW